jgi:hypothetical protein
MVFVARLNDQGIEILSANEMEQSVISSPVPMNGKILIRGEKDLFCFSDR